MTESCRRARVRDDDEANTYYLGEKATGDNASANAVGTLSSAGTNIGEEAHKGISSRLAAFRRITSAMVC